MFIRELSECRRFTAGDESTLAELLNPLKEDLPIRYSLAHATVKPGRTTLKHKLTASEVYYILEGSGIMYIGGRRRRVSANQTVYIPPNQPQKIANTGNSDLIFLCIADPAWRAENEQVLEKRNKKGPGAEGR
jgi:mannose-6-phosphate isomerase-like protein (cupin superfamily)